MRLGTTLRAFDITKNVAELTVHRISVSQGAADNLDDGVLQETDPKVEEHEKKCDP